jgi:hypothetical protein
MITTIHRWWSLCLFMTMWSINGWTSILWCSLFLDKPLDGDHYVDPYCDHKNSIHLKQGSQFFVTTILKGPKRWVNNLNRQLMQRWVATNTVFLPVSITIQPFCLVEAMGYLHSPMVVPTLQMLRTTTKSMTTKLWQIAYSIVYLFWTPFFFWVCLKIFCSPNNFSDVCFGNMIIKQ